MDDIHILNAIPIGLHLEEKKWEEMGRNGKMGTCVQG
jgi:hypothetical protein